MHNELQNYFCETCPRALCHECKIIHHDSHSVINLIDATNKAITQANNIIEEAKHGISSMRDDLDTIRIAAETLDRKARQATADVILNKHHIIAAIEAREKELVNKIEKTRIEKLNSLKKRDEGLKKCILQLSRTINNMSKALESRSVVENPLKLVITREISSAEVNFILFFFNK